MIQFITFLRALAACLITNAHYTGIYPTDLIANGGLIGDILFFAVSGYCLYNVKYALSPKGFLSWYGKRLWRVFLPVWICTLVYMLLHCYTFGEYGMVWWYIYPTCYHFVASIIILYIPFFFIMKLRALRENLHFVMLAVALLYFAVYLFFYDKSYYHIDTVREPMIRFLFMESMLLGAWFRQNDGSFRNKRSIIKPIGTVVTFIMYFVSKLAFQKFSALSRFQIVNQLIIFALLFFLFATASSLDESTERSPKWLKNSIGFISSITLEIYVVQSVLISTVRDFGLPFPVNWFAVTFSILAAAFTLHVICKGIYWSVDRLIAVCSVRNCKSSQ